MLMSGRTTSSARRERPMAKPIATPAAAASAKPASSRMSVSSTWCAKTPSAVRRSKAAATSSSGGNSLRGKTPRRAVTSQATATTRNGNAVRAISRQRLSPRWAAGPAGSICGDTAGATLDMSRTIVPPHLSGQAASAARMRAARARRWICVRAAVTTNSPMHAMTVLERVPKPLAAALAIGLTLAAGVAGGFAARLVHLPLPWLLGALFTTMVLSLAGAPVRLIPWGRPVGTVVVGASTGLQFTATVVAKLVTLLPLIIAAAFISTIVGAIGGLLYIRLTGIDRVTAFFATVPGGLVETMTIAPYYGGHLEPIMVAQTTRVALIVVFAPFLVISFVGGGAQNPLLAIPVVPWLPILGLILVSGVVATLLSRTRSPNAWLIAPLFIAAAASHLGWMEGRMPDVLLIAAQVLIGSALGAQFRL